MPTVKAGAEILCEFVTENQKNSIFTKDANAATTQAVKDMGGALGKIIIIPIPNKNPSQRILYAGLGDPEQMTPDTIRHISGKIAQAARELKVSEFSIIEPEHIKQVTSVISQITEGVKMALYTFDEFKQKKADPSPNLVIISQKGKKAQQEAKTAEIIADGALLARNTANLPPNQCNPSTLAKIAKKIAENHKVKCTIISKQELANKGFGGITAVGQGSINKPKLIILEYKGGKSTEKPVVIVGKAVTFDTGGISIKPSENLEEMKFDKCGGCTVLGIIRAASELQLSTNIIGVIPSVENMPGGESYRPGDIIKLYSGKTAEIANTDAEGRLILADAIAYAEKRYKPVVIVDLATLTGACIVALGSNVAGMVSNDKIVAAEVAKASKITSEHVWELPLNQDYMDMIKSEVADMKNLGIARAAGTITAAAFLRNAILMDTPWVHLDIAGVAWTQPSTKYRSYNPKGATGFGVRLLMDWLIHRQKQ